MRRIITGADVAPVVLGLNRDLRSPQCTRLQISTIRQGKLWQSVNIYQCFRSNLFCACT